MAWPGQVNNLQIRSGRAKPKGAAVHDLPTSKACPMSPAVRWEEKKKLLFYAGRFAYFWPTCKYSSIQSNPKSNLGELINCGVCSWSANSRGCMSITECLDPMEFESHRPNISELAWDINNEILCTVHGTPWSDGSRGGSRGVVKSVGLSHPPPTTDHCIAITNEATRCSRWGPL